MIVTDSAIHIWEPPTAEKPWAESRFRSKAHGVDPSPEFSAEDVLDRMADAGVDRAILVPPTFAGSPNDYSFEAAAKYPDRFAVMASIHLNRPDGAEHLKKLIDRGALGVRVTFHHAYDESWVRDGTSDWFWPLAEKLNISVMFNGPTIHKEIAQLAQRHPGLRLIFDHMGVVKGVKDDKVQSAMAPTLELAEFPNVYVKLTNLPTYSTQQYPFPALFPALKQMIKTFGPRRCLWGTNLSSMLHHGKCTYPQAVTMFTEEMDFLSREDLEWVMGRALEECLGWPVAAGLAAKKVA